VPDKLHCYVNFTSINPPCLASKARLRTSTINQATALSPGTTDKFMIHRSLKPFLAAVLCLSALASLRAENWAQWRGPNFNGSTSEKNLPATFSKTENVVWSAPMPGPSGATPVVWGDYVFVSSTDDTAKTCVALAFDRKTGKDLWRVKVADGAGQDRMSTFSNSSPVTDGKHVWFFYGNGELVCFDLAGKEVWRRNIEKDYGQFAFQWTFSSSPLLHDGRLYLQVLQRDVPVNGRGRKDGPNESYLLALDPRDRQGALESAAPRRRQARNRSKPSPHPRLTSTPGARNCSSWAAIASAGTIRTPARNSGAGAPGTPRASGTGGWCRRPPPARASCWPAGRRMHPIYAVKLGGNGTLSNAGLAWQSYVQNTEETNKVARSLETRELSSDVPTPLFYEGKFYVLNGNKKKLLCLEPSGKIVWSGDLGKGNFQSSPTAADGKIYMMNFPGEVFVVQAGGSEFKLLHSAAMGEGENTLRASIPISQGQLFIRTSKTLYCVGKK